MLVIECPKRYFSRRSTELFEYYAGYSFEFAQSLLEHVPDLAGGTVLDPWNGAGTTTAAASNLGIASVGRDLNPSMVVTAKARLLSKDHHPKITSIWSSIAAALPPKSSIKNTEPLRDWFDSDTSNHLRQIERSIARILLGELSDCYLTGTAIDNMSALAAYFYTALFKTTKDLLRPLRPSNPTWIKRPKTDSDKVSATKNYVLDLLKQHLSEPTLLDHIASSEVPSSAEIRIGNSECLDLPSSSVDLVLTSPPYCTRIDYAVTTAAELAILGIGQQQGLRELRDSLMGTTTVRGAPVKIDERWGTTCANFLSELHDHSSHASRSYYFKNHMKYFASLSSSIQEISRVLKPGGIFSVVVQDSYYKNIRNDLAKITAEMASAAGLTWFQQEDFRLSISMGSINRRGRTYRDAYRPTESVICFFK